MLPMSHLSNQGILLCMILVLEFLRYYFYCYEPESLDNSLCLVKASVYVVGGIHWKDTKSDSLLLIHH